MNLVTMVFALATVSFTSQADRHACPEGQVWGGAKCEWSELCSGSWAPPIHGRCPGDPCPAGTVEIAGHCESPPTAEECSGRVEFAPHRRSARRVVLSDGEGSVLLDRYISEARQAGLLVDYESIRVIFFLAGSKRVEAVGRPRTQAEKMAGISAEEVMLRRLRNDNFRHAAKITPSQKAGVRGTEDDFVCGGQTVIVVP